MIWGEKPGPNFLTNMLHVAQIKKHDNNNSNTLNTMCLNHLILITILIKCDYPHFTNQETEAHGDWRLPTCIRPIK